MTTIIERPSGESSDGGSSIAVLGIIVGALAAAVIAMVAYSGGFDRGATNDTNLTITTPTAPSNPPVPESTPTEAQPSPQPTPEPSPAPVQ